MGGVVLMCFPSLGYEPVNHSGCSEDYAAAAAAAA